MSRIVVCPCRVCRHLSLAVVAFPAGLVARRQSRGIYYQVPAPFWWRSLSPCKIVPLLEVQP